MEDLPVIACTLTADELPRRMAEIEALGRDALLLAERRGRELELRFETGGETLERIEALVEAESRCCAFLDFEIDRRDNATVLTIASPPGGEPVLDELADRFAATDPS